MLPEDAVTAMWEQQLPIPEQHQFAGIGLSWRVGSWGGVRVLAHDGGTIGQSARLRLLPDLDVAACLLTHSGNGEALADRLLPEVLREVAGVDVPALPEPDPDAHPGELERHAGRYQRRGMTYDVDVADGRLDITVTSTLGIEELDEPETLRMHPVDGSGDRFVGRADSARSWWPVTFATLPDGRAQLCGSGRVAPRA